MKFVLKVVQNMYLYYPILFMRSKIGLFYDWIIHILFQCNIEGGKWLTHQIRRPQQHLLHIDFLPWCCNALKVLRILFVWPWIHREFLCWNYNALYTIKTIIFQFDKKRNLPDWWCRHPDYLNIWILAEKPS